jgi:NADH-quinone oxidoreductase subunit E
MAFSENARSKLDPKAAEIIGRYPKARSALLPLLHLVQSEEGFVSADGIEFCAEQLGLSQADVTGVVSFYTMYARRRCARSWAATRFSPTCSSTWASATTRPLPTAR